MACLIGRMLSEKLKSEKLQNAVSAFKCDKGGIISSLSDMWRHVL